MVAAQPIAEMLGLGAVVGAMQELDIAVSAGQPKRSLVLLSSRLYCDDRAASAPNRELGGKTPIEASQTEIGARRVEAVLNRLFFALPA